MFLGSQFDPQMCFSSLVNLVHKITNKRDTRDGFAIFIYEIFESSNI
jgi:hypothetical protein